MLLPPQSSKKKKRLWTYRRVPWHWMSTWQRWRSLWKGDQPASLRKGCLNKAKSAVVLSEGEPSAGTMAVLERLVSSHRTVRFCLVDHSKYKLSVGKKATWNKKFKGLLSAPMEDGEARLVLFLKDKKKKEKETKRTGRTPLNCCWLRRSQERSRVRRVWTHFWKSG